MQVFGFEKNGSNEVPFEAACFQYCYDIEGPLFEQDEEGYNIDD